MQLKALIFDVDGTLADTEEVHRQAFNLTFAKFGLPWHWSPEQYIALLSISGGRRRIRYFAEQHRRDLPQDADLDEWALRLHRDKTARYGRMVVNEGIPLRPGVRRLIDEARNAGLRLGIATSTALGNVELLLDRNLPAGWRDWFDVVASCEQIGEQKPSPAIYRYVLEQLDVTTDQAVAFEDTGNGLLAARRAGLRTIITQHYFTSHHDFTGAALVLSDLGEPDAPFTLVKGEVDGQGHVDLDLLESLLPQQEEQPRPRALAAKGA